MAKIELAAERLTNALNALEAVAVPLKEARDVAQAEARAAQDEVRAVRDEAERVREDAEAARAEAEAARAAAGETDAAFAQADDARARMAEANAERERLLARIAELEEDQQVLTEISEEVETRLDGAIAEIRGALGRV
jgi:colicin import membrane protein